MVEIRVRDRNLIIKLEGSERFLALKRRVNIPLSNITNVSTKKVSPPWFAGKIGSHFPPFFWAGTFCTRRGKEFYYVKNVNKCITINLQNHNYNSIIIEVKDNEATAEEIKKHLGKHKTPSLHIIGL